MKEDIYRKFEITIASLPDRENCVCEIYFENTLWVEISKESKELTIQFYSNQNETYWEFPLEVALDILQKGKERFLKGIQG